MTRDLSPEERLLRLIKQPTKPAEPKENKAEQSPQKATIEKDSKTRDIQVIARNLFSKRKELDLFKISIVLLAAVLVLGIFYFSFEFFGKKEKYNTDIERLIIKDEKKIKPQPAQQEIAPEPKEESPAEFKELFGAPVTRETQSIQEGPTAAELMKNLTLLGVITGNNPQAIIEDKQTRQTYYVCENENVLQFKIIKIEKAVVVLGYNGETFKLSL